MHDPNRKPPTRHFSGMSTPIAVCLKNQCEENDAVSPLEATIVSDALLGEHPLEVRLRR